MKYLKIYQTSDIHGNIFPTNYVNDTNYGLAKVSSLIKSRVDQDNYKLIIDSGDVLQGNSLAFYNEKFQNFSPSIIDGFNLIGYDGLTLGNHEFNYGLDYLKEHYLKFNNPILNANIKGLPFETKPYHIYTFDDLKVAVIGLTTSFIPNWENPENIKGLEFLDPIETYRKYEAEMCANANIIIVNYHGGFEADIDDGVTLTEADTSENVGSKLTRTFNSIDIILTGHQHRIINGETNGVICMQPGCNGAQVSEIVIELETAKIVKQSLISCDEIVPDQQILELFSEQNNACNAYLDTPLSVLDRDITITNVADARLNSHPFLSFLGQAFTNYVNADFVALSLFDTAIGFNQNVTIRQVNQNYPFPNTVMKIALSGRQMICAIKQAAKYYTLEDDQIIVNPSYITPKLKHYNYDMYWGITYKVIVKADDNLVTDVLVKGKPIELDKQYTMLVSNYRYNNRGDYPVYNDVQLISETQDDAIEILLSYLANNPKLTIKDTIDYKITK